MTRKAPSPPHAWKALRDAAVAYVEHGWPVLPGTYPSSRNASRCWLGRADATTMLPLADEWTGCGITDPDETRRVWHDHPYSILLPCGRFADCLEVPAAVGNRVTRALREHRCRVPLLADPSRRRLLLTRPGDEPVDVTTWHPGTRHHGTGQWIPLPPSRYGALGCTWHVPPAACSWVLPEAAAIHRIVRESLREYTREPV